MFTTADNHLATRKLIEHISDITLQRPILAPTVPLPIPVSARRLPFPLQGDIASLNRGKNGMIEGSPQRSEDIPMQRDVDD